MEADPAQFVDDDEACDSLGAAVSGSSTAPPRRRWLSISQCEAIRRVPHFRDSEYRALDLNVLLDSYVHDFVEPLLRLAGDPGTVADVGAGYGWLAIAFALRTGARVFVLEYDAARLAAARQIAGIAGVADRIVWAAGSVGAIPWPDRSIDAVYCVEVLEHAGTAPALVGELARISRDVLVITTPNKAFPVIGHDTALPLCHLLPLRARDVYAAAFGRRGRQDNNLFWSPWRLFGALEGFRRVSRFMQFDSYRQYREARERSGRGGGLGAACKAAYFAPVSRFGRHTIFFLPNLASTFRREPDAVLTGPGSCSGRGWRRSRRSPRPGA